jgi:hypothetical protein
LNFVLVLNFLVVNFYFLFIFFRVCKDIFVLLKKNLGLFLYFCWF